MLWRFISLDLSSVVNSVLLYKSQAESEAGRLYAGNENMINAYKHFTWNWLMTKYMSKTKARIVGNNHEWGLVMIPDVLAFYDTRYNYHRARGNSIAQAASFAFVEATSYIPVLKSNLVASMWHNFNTFKKYFTPDCMVDLWNNCYGRSYVASHPSASFNSAFNISKNNVELCLAPNQMTTTRQRNIYDWDWWSY